MAEYDSFDPLLEDLESDIISHEDSLQLLHAAQTPRKDGMVRLPMMPGGIETTILRRPDLGEDGMMIIEGHIGSQRLVIDGEAFELLPLKETPKGRPVVVLTDPSGRSEFSYVPVRPSLLEDTQGGPYLEEALLLGLAVVTISIVVAVLLEAVGAWTALMELLEALVGGW